MSTNGKAPLHFPAQAGAHIIGQPFTLESVWVPCSAQLRCNCGGTDVSIKIENSTAVSCPGCQKVYNCAFNPMQNKVEFQIAVPEPPRVAS